MNRYMNALKRIHSAATIGRERDVAILNAAKQICIEVAEADMTPDELATLLEEFEPPLDSNELLCGAVAAFLELARRGQGRLSSTNFHRGLTKTRGASGGRRWRSPPPAQKGNGNHGRAALDRRVADVGRAVKQDQCCPRHRGSARKAGAQVQSQARALVQGD